MAIRGRHDDETRSILDAVRRLLRHVRNVAATTHGSLGITAAQLFVVQTLAEAGSDLSVNELAERTYTDQSTLSVVAKRLEERGLIVRRRSAEDRRRVHLSVTAKGRALVRRNIPSPQHGLLEGIRRLPPGARAGLAAHLQALVRAMGVDRTPAPMMFEDDTRSPRRAARAAALTQHGSCSGGVLPRSTDWGQYTVRSPRRSRARPRTPRRPGLGGKEPLLTQAPETSAP